MLIDFLTYLGWPIALSTLWLAGITWIMITLLMPGWIRLMSQQTHQVREDVPERHLGKQGTPSMGGVPWLLVLFGMLLKRKLNVCLFGVLPAFVCLLCDVCFRLRSNKKRTNQLKNTKHDLKGPIKPL